MTDRSYLALGSRLAAQLHGLGRTSLAAVGAEAIISRLHQCVQPLFQRLLRHRSKISLSLSGLTGKGSKGGRWCVEVLAGRSIDRGIILLHLAP